MKTNMQDIVDRTYALRDICTDYNASAKQFGYTPEDKSAFMFVDNETQIATVGKLNDHAFTQLTSRILGQYAPTKWIKETCPDDVYSYIMNEMSQRHDNGDMFIRMRGETVRAVLSEKYAPFDNYRFLDLVVKALGDGWGNVEVWRAMVGDTLRAYITTPWITTVTVPQDRELGGLNPAVYIYNNEIGLGGTRVCGGLFRPICTNGAMVWKDAKELFYKVHRGYKRDSLILPMVADALIEGFQMSEELADAFIGTIEIPVETNVLERLTKQWSKKYGITIDAQENWLAAITAESASYGRANDVRQFDVINAATLVAQTRSADEAQKMEAMAGEYIQLFQQPVSVLEE